MHVNRSRHERKASAANKWWALCCCAQRSSLRRTNCRPACLEMEHSGGFWMGSTAATFWIMQVLKSSSVLSSTLLLLSGWSGSQNLCQCMNINRFKNKDVQCNFYSHLWKHQEMNNLFWLLMAVLPNILQSFLYCDTVYTCPVTLKMLPTCYHLDTSALNDSRSFRFVSPHKTQVAYIEFGLYSICWLLHLLCLCSRWWGWVTWQYSEVIRQVFSVSLLHTNPR